MENNDSPAFLAYDSGKNKYSVHRRNPEDKSRYFMRKGALMDLGLFEWSQQVDKDSLFPVLQTNELKLLPHGPPKKDIVATDLNIYSSKDKLPAKPSYEVKTHFSRVLKEGYYADGEILCKALNPDFDWLESMLHREVEEEKRGAKRRRKKSVKTKANIRWGYDKARDRIIVIIGNEGATLIMKNGLNEILGFDKTHLYTGSHVAQKAPLLNRGIYNFYIYCNICSDVQVGNVKAPLLQTVEVDEGKKWGIPRTIRFTRPIYVPLNTNNFHSILIEIRDDTGELVHFGKGKTVLTLHFRRRGMKI